MRKPIDPALVQTRAKAVIGRGRRANWWRRRGSLSRGFTYLDQAGKKVDKTQLERIAALVIPPAWENVRINPAPGGKIQAVGMDTTGRVQYLYHPSYSEKQKRSKFARIALFGDSLPILRRTIVKDIKGQGLTRERVLATVTRLIDLSYFRVGTDLSEQQYETYGVTTLHKKHVSLGPNGRIEFAFVGKSHVEHRKVIVDKKVAVVLAELIQLGRGRKVFRYVDENGTVHPVSPSKINAYIKQSAGGSFSSKDFRTWGATMLAADSLAKIGPASDENEAKKNIVEAIKTVAEELGNTPAVCRESYIHPSVLVAYDAGVTIEKFRNRRYPTKELALVKLLRS